MNSRTFLGFPLLASVLLGASVDSSEALVPAALRYKERAFGLEQAHAMADAQRTALYGVCGMCVFKEQRGPVWVFQTKVGYGGVPAADICIIAPSTRLPEFHAKLQIANKSLQVTPTADTMAAGAPIAPAAGVPDL